MLHNPRLPAFTVLQVLNSLPTPTLLYVFPLKPIEVCIELTFSASRNSPSPLVQLDRSSPNLSPPPSVNSRRVLRLVCSSLWLSIVDLRRANWLFSFYSIFNRLEVCLVRDEASWIRPECHLQVSLIGRKCCFEEWWAISLISSFPSSNIDLVRFIDL